MAKFLLLIALAIFAYLLLKGLRRDAKQDGSVRASQSRDEPVPEDMVRCARCGVHLPRSESFTSRGQFFCSDEHRRLGVR
ncbi:MAG TPA: PP0621 family protein [Burkholderiales bacterium]|nr:PP0621 family protein [Burkholderiales bacterium]